MTRTFEDNEVGPEVERIFADIRASFDLPFVPAPFRVLAGIPEYLRLMWRDLGHVAASREFRSAAVALQEFIRSEAITGGWRFCDQERVLAGQKISSEDTLVLSGVVGVFNRALPALTLFLRLMQLGYSGGTGRTGDARKTFSRALAPHYFEHPQRTGSQPSGVAAL